MQVLMQKSSKHLGCSSRFIATQC